jgi:four helix bundle protein
MRDKKVVFSFEKLEVWQKAKLFCTTIYKLSREFPKEEQYGLTNQIRRAAVSVSANIAEGTSKISNKDQARFTVIAYASLMEVASHLEIARELEYINDDKILDDTIRPQIAHLANMLNNLRKYQLNQKK